MAPLFVSKACGIVALIVSLLLPGARAEITAPLPVPPQAMPLSVTVARGGRVEISLRGYGKANQQWRFKLRVQPALGRVSLPENVSLESATVLYEHGGRAVPAHDHFSYVVQSSAGVSVPAEVEIKIVDDPPLLVVPEDLDFKTVAPGSSAERGITIENRGGGVAGGALIAPENWSVRGSPQYRLDRGEQAKFALVFTPNGERAYRGELRYSSHLDRVTSLRGAGLFPLVAQPAMLVLRAAAGSAMRAGAIELENRTETPQTARITSSDGLLAPDKIELPAYRKTVVPIAAATDNPAAFRGKITATTPQTSAVAEVRIEALGPILRSETKDVSLPKNVAESEVILENAGGTRAFVQAVIPDPFALAEADRAFSLAPGEKRAVHLSIATRGSEGARTSVAFVADQSRLEIPIRAEGERTMAVKASLPVSNALDNRQTTETPAEPEVFAKILPVQNVSVIGLTPTSADLRWRAPEATPARYAIEQRLLSLDAQHELKIEWTPPPDLEIRVLEKEVTATLRKLQPGSLHSLRIVSLDAQGLRSAPSPTVEFFTLAPPARSFRWLLWPLVAGLIGAVVWRRLYPTRND